MKKDTMHHKFKLVLAIVIIIVAIFLVLWTTSQIPK